jgi:hypothetical protein
LTPPAEETVSLPAGAVDPIPTLPEEVISNISLSALDH